MKIKTWFKKKINSVGWIDKWEKNETAFHRDYPSPDLIGYFDSLELPAGAHILVPLCGKSKDVLWLANKGYRVTGIEVSPLACQELFAEMNVSPQISQHKHFVLYQYQNIKILCGDFFKLKKADVEKIDGIYDCRAFVALAPELRQDYIHQLIDCSSDPIKILLIGFSASSNIPGPPFSVTTSEIINLFGAKLKVKTLKNELLLDPPKHLVARGFKDIYGSVYLISNQ